MSTMPPVTRARWRASLRSASLRQVPVDTGPGTSGPVITGSCHSRVGVVTLVAVRLVVGGRAGRWAPAGWHLARGQPPRRRRDRRTTGCTGIGRAAETGAPWRGRAAHTGRAETAAAETGAPGCRGGRAGGAGGQTGAPEPASAETGRARGGGVVVLVVATTRRSAEAGAAGCGRVGTGLGGGRGPPWRGQGHDGRATRSGPARCVTTRRAGRAPRRGAARVRGWRRGRIPWVDAVGCSHGGAPLPGGGGDGGRPTATGRAPGPVRTRVAGRSPAPDSPRRGRDSPEARSRAACSRVVRSRGDVAGLHVAGTATGPRRTRAGLELAPPAVPPHEGTDDQDDPDEGGHGTQGDRAEHRADDGAGVDDAVAGDGHVDRLEAGAVELRLDGVETGLAHGELARRATHVGPEAVGGRRRRRHRDRLAAGCR